MHNDFTQENALWAQLQTQTAPNKQRQQLLEMARLLLLHAQMDTATTTQLATDDLTDLFLEYQMIGETIAQFLQKSLPFLDPDYRGQAFEQELQALQEKLAQDKAQARTLQNQLQTLREEQTQLTQTVQQQQAIEQEVQTLTTNIAKLKQELSYLQQRPARLTALAESSIQLYQEAQQAIIDAIPQIMNLVQANKELYKKHFKANQQIMDAMQLPNITEEISSPVQKIAQVTQAIEKNLQTFDQQLQSLILTNETQLRESRQLREPSGS
ncbi:hypothetical protein [Beggiatoa leptomitoformis]|uniref:Uncharacterized protein n=1 Tax=Beggiatoa leptomitoformis TaxID=288004 RepID=A0A2N9YD63_9GAMM|nr:hypothetical protein [Beggiatoa leptomitoformis]ALG69183.1 hypothetical protein AL038_17685 [Beggiatoa leptomitoformis]AUI68391.1 hypothetical protein BLE401_06545 [Beggiatoa leptomitoformis]